MSTWGRVEVSKPPFFAQTFRKHALNTWHSSRSIKVSSWPQGGRNCVHQYDKGSSKAAQSTRRAQRKGWLVLPGNIRKSIFEDITFFFFFSPTSRDMWDLRSWLGIKPRLPQWKHGFLTTGWPRRSQEHGFWAKPWKAPLAGGKGAPGEREKQVLLNLCLPGTRTNPSRAWAVNLRVTLNKEWGELGTGASLDL